MPRAETISPNAKENVVHDLVNVYDWVMLPSSVGEKFFRNGTIELSQFPCHQLNGSFCALSARRKTVQWYCQGCFDENADYEGVVFVVRRRSKNEAQRKWVAASNNKPWAPQPDARSPINPKPYTLNPAYPKPYTLHRPLS